MNKGLIIGLGAFVLVVLTFLYTPKFLAPSNPVNGHALVVEGWMDERNLPAVARLSKEYDQVIVTGTHRPFAYYLRGGERITLKPERPVQNHVAIEAAGVPGARLILLQHLQDTLIDIEVPGDVRTFHANFSGEATDLELRAYHRLASGDTTDIIFIREVLLGNAPAHTMSEVFLIDKDSMMHPGSPTHAHFASERIVELGVPKNKITIAAARIGDEGRTVSNAHAAATAVKHSGCKTVDLVSEGVHARRSWNALRTALEHQADVGVIALPDPECEQPWSNVNCLRKLGKELLGMAR